MTYKVYIYISHISKSDAGDTSVNSTSYLLIGFILRNVNVHVQYT